MRSLFYFYRKSLPKLELEEKRRAAEEERQRLEQLRIQEEYRKQREEEVERLTKDYLDLLDRNLTKERQEVAEEKYEVLILILFFIFFHLLSSHACTLKLYL
jgi:uncharacterized protein with von Willebrand factor type A (vWA) domain